MKCSNYMISTDIGPLDGNKWESLIQSVYKRNHDMYQEMLASPGDLGIEGFILGKGVVIQCYCPDKEYDTATLHTKQVNKITADLQKLSKYADELKRHLGDTKITQWIFATPRVAKHDIHKHARAKEIELRGYGLDILDEKFTILVKDLAFFEVDIRKIQVVGGHQLDFSGVSGIYIPEPKLTTTYDKNITDKNEIRSAVKNIYDPDVHTKLNDLTKKSFLEGYDILKVIHRQSPELYEKIAKVVNNFEADVEEESLTWEDSPRQLIENISLKLMHRLEKDSFISAAINHENLVAIVKHMIARWIAHCPMRITE
jgi:hypothetical protein